MTDTHAFWGREQRYEVRNDGTGNVEFTVVPLPTYGGEVIVSIPADDVLRLADEIVRARAGGSHA